MITSRSKIDAIRAEDEQARQAALAVLRETYRNEKHWTSDEQTLFHESDLTDPSISWFVAFAENAPAGVLRVLYDPPLELYMKYGFEKIGTEELNVDEFLANNKIAEIGRLAVAPKYRTKITTVAALIRLAIKDAVTRGYSHYITDIFENEQHNPYLFHTRILGFTPVATHATGELAALNRRITLILNIKACYQRLKKNGNWIYRYLTEGWDAKLHEQLSSDLRETGRETAALGIR
jgi:hypothetical protein